MPTVSGRGSYEHAPAPAAPDPIEQLTQLAELHTQGVLTDTAFAKQKAKVLG